MEGVNTVPAKIAVFDLEMPSARRDAISAVGITLIEDGKITNSYYTLVNPECPFDPFTVELTGITPEMAAAHPNFGALWEEMRPWFDGALLCAHGAADASRTAAHDHDVAGLGVLGVVLDGSCCFFGGFLGVGACVRRAAHQAGAEDARAYHRGST